MGLNQGSRVANILETSAENQAYTVTNQARLAVTYDFEQTRRSNGYIELRALYVELTSEKCWPKCTCYWNLVAGGVHSGAFRACFFDRPSKGTRTRDVQQRSTSGGTSAFCVLLEPTQVRQSNGVTIFSANNHANDIQNANPS